MRDIPTPTPQDIDADITSAEDLHQQLAAAIAEAEKTGDFTKAEEIQKQLEAKLEPLKEEVARRQETPAEKKERKRVADAKNLEDIEDRFIAGEELTKEDLRFLYQIDDQIIGIDDCASRIRVILANRDNRADIAGILGIDLGQVSLTEEEALRGDIVFHYGHLAIGLKSAEGLTLPKTVNGYLYLGSLTSAEGLTLPKIVNGHLDLSSLTSAEGLTLPETVNGGLYLNSLTSAEGLTLPETVNGNFNLQSLTSAEGLALPKTINGDFNLQSLTSAEGLTLPGTVNGNLYLSRLTSAEGLTLPETVNGNLYLSSLPVVEKNSLQRKYPQLRIG